MYDYLIVDSGLYGSILAREATNKGYKVLVLDKRSHIAGNIYTEKVEGINLSREYSSEWKPGDEAYYPVNDEKNSSLFAEYKALADKEENVIFGGRLGEYKYYHMDATVATVLNMCKKELRL